MSYKKTVCVPSRIYYSRHHPPFQVASVFSWGGHRVKYFWNTKAWMTGAVWREWLHDFNMRAHGKKILLLVDNAPGHVDVQMTNIRLHFLPANTTSLLQPMNAGIIRNFKCKYKVLFVRWVIDQLDARQSGAQIKDVKLDVLTAIKSTVDAWADVTATTIRNCWCHTGIVPGADVARLRQENDPKRLSDKPELTTLIERLASATRWMLKLMSTSKMRLMQRASNQRVKATHKVNTMRTARTMINIHSLMAKPSLLCSNYPFMDLGRGLSVEVSTT